MRGSNMVDLTGEEQDYPYLQSGTLGSPFPRALQNIYRPPILVNREPEIGYTQPKASLSLSNQAPVYKDISQVNGALMELHGRPLAQMTVPRSPVPDKRQEHPRLLQQPNINAPLSSPPPINAPSTLIENEKTLVQDYTSRVDMPVVTDITAKENQIPVPQLREDLHIPSPVAVSCATPEFRIQPAGSEEPNELPLTLEAFQRTLQECLHELHVDHQYYIKSRLSYARQHHTSYTAVGKSSATATTGDLADPTHNMRSDFLQKNSPFTHLAPVRRDRDAATPSQQWTGKLCQLGAKATKQGPEISTVSCIPYSAGNVAIPPYTNYISTKRNILIEDDKNRTFLPYYGDDASVDYDYADLESRITRNRSYYHHTNSIAEKAKIYGPYIKIFLAKLGCDVSMILRYLLDETNPTAPRELTPSLATIWLNREAHLKEGYYDDSEESDASKTRNRVKAGWPQKHWQAVFNGLPTPSTSREAAAAGIACAAFANVLEFSLWHVVKRHRLVLDAVTRKHRTTDNVDRVAGPANGSPTNLLSPTRDSDPLGTYADLGCLVCYAHECPGHGEFEDEDDEKNVRIRINAKPPSPKSPKDRVGRHLTNEEHTTVTPSFLEAIVGINKDKSITGKPWVVFKDEDSGFKDDEMCSDKCFWLKSNRSISSSSWTDYDLKLFNTLSPAHQGNRRGPCLLALGMSKPCNELLASGGVSGWGLYMGEATKKGDYIGEYVGEVISKEESEQRGIIYNKRNLSYLFDLNSTQTLDSTLIGNKLRYINHQAPPYANCQAKTLFCNTVHRIGMFACRNIEVGEEILFDYGEGFAAKFDLIKLDDQAQPRIEPRRKGVAYKINKDPDRAPRLSKNGKRIGRPRKSAPSDQGVKESAILVGIISAPKEKIVAPMLKRSHKRKRPPPSLGLDGVVDDENFEDILPSDEAIEDPSSDSFHWSNDEDEFKLTRPAQIEASRQRGWRSRLSSRGRKKGRGNGMGSSVAVRQPRKLNDRDFDAREMRESAILQERRGKAASKTHRNDGRRERRDGPVALSHNIYDFGAPQKRGLETRHPAIESNKGKGKEKEHSDREAAEDLHSRQDSAPIDNFLKGGWKIRYTEMDRTNEGTHESVQIGSSSAQHADERPEPETPQMRGARTRTANRLKRSLGGGHSKHRKRL
ncbi:hypothetical protein MMC18_003463 [Xylographa bjoerkii]|nr:hypothetical protein [Xylographa bjoerkii]